jgi:hypothetical protein
MVTSLLDTSITISGACTSGGAALLTVLAALPDSALLTPKEAAAYIRSTAEVLRVWRHRCKGPRFCGRGHFIRYQKADLDEFMRGFDHRFLSKSKGDAARAMLPAPNAALNDEHAAWNGSADSPAAGLKTATAAHPVTSRGNPGASATTRAGYDESGRLRSDELAWAEANAQRTSKS